MSVLKKKPLISIITPVFNEEEGLSTYEKEAYRIFLSREDLEFEIILVDDGSTDQSWAFIKLLCERDRHYRGIRLSRNFGSHIALAAGLKRAKGEAVAILACDLQDPPECILEFIDVWGKGCHIVWGKRLNRGDSFWRVATSKLFKYLLEKLAMPKGSKFTTGSFLLLDRVVVDWYNTFREHNRITFALIAWMGFSQEVIPYARRSRKTGKSGWTFMKMLRTFYDAIIGFSYVRFLSMLGIFVSLGNGFFALYVVLNWIVKDVKPGWTSIVLLISFFSGLQLIILGFIAEFLYRVHMEVTNRPLYCISCDTEKMEQRDFTQFASPPPNE